MSTLGEIYGRPGRKSTDKLSAVDLMPILLAHGADPNATLKTPTLTRAHTPGEAVWEKEPRRLCAPPRMATSRRCAC